MLTEEQATECAAIVEASPLVKKWIPQEYVIAARMTFGEDPPVPAYVLLGELPCCRAEDDGSNPEIILPANASVSLFMHEYAHWLAFTYYPQLVVQASREKNEKWAKMVEEAYKKQVHIPYPQRVMHSFYTTNQEYD